MSERVRTNVCRFRERYIRNNPGMPCDTVESLIFKLPKRPQKTETTAWKLAIIAPELGCVSGNLGYAPIMSARAGRYAASALGISKTTMRRRLKKLRECGNAPESLDEFSRMPDAMLKKVFSYAEDYKYFIGRKVCGFEVTDLCQNMDGVKTRWVFTLRCPRCGKERWIAGDKLRKVVNGRLKQSFICACRPKTNFRPNGSCAARSALMRQRIREAFRAMCRGIDSLDPKSREIMEASMSQWTIHAGTVSTIHARLECYLKGMNPEELM